MKLAGQDIVLGQFKDDLQPLISVEILFQNGLGRRGPGGEVAEVEFALGQLEAHVRIGGVQELRML